MYPSNINGGGYTTPISFTLDQTIPYTSTFIQDDPPSSFLYFPSPSLPYEDDIFLRHHLHDLFLQQPPLTAAAATAPEATSDAVGFIPNDIDGRKGGCNERCHGGPIEQIPRRRSSKKDRHSKIDTAQGPRDRRMRLSLEVAPQFFGLQDLLGFDKASKTVGWLLNKSKAAIKELKRGLQVPRMNNSSSSASEGEAMSGIDEPAGDGTRPARTDKGKSSSSFSVAKEKKIRASRKPAFNPVAKESREKARARARERTQRTREKRRLGEPNPKLAFDATNHEMNQFGCWSSHENGEESGTQSLNTNPSLDMIAEVEELSSSIIFSYYNRRNTGISQEHQFTDFQVHGKLWEA